MANINVGLESWVTIGSLDNGKFHLKYQIWARQESADIANNRTHIWRRLYLEVDSGGSIGAVNYTYSGTGLPTESGGSISINATTTLVESEEYVTHNADGNWSQSVNGTANFGNTYVWTTSTNTAVLPTIARASSPTVSPASVSVDGSNTVTVTTNRKSTAFTHDITITVGSYTQTKTGVGDSTSFTIPLSAFSNTTTSQSLTGTISVQTKNGSTNIGSAQSITFTALANSTEFKPTLSNYSATETNSGTTGASGWNVVKGVSSKTVSVKVTGKQGATISKVTVAVGNGSAVNMTNNDGVWSATLRNISSNVFTFTATDSRKNTATGKVSSGTLYNYTKPQITVLTVARTSSNSTNGTLTVKGTYWNSTTPKTNNITFKIKVGSTTGSAITPTKSGKNWSSTQSLTGLTTTETFVYTVTATDEYGQTATATYTLSGESNALILLKETAYVNDFIVEGRMKVEGGSFVHGALDADRVAGYTNFCRVKITKTYANSEPLTFIIQGQGSDNVPVRVTLSFANEESLDPALGAFIHEGHYPIYIKKATTSTWDLYYHKQGNHDEVNVLDFYITKWMMNRCQIEWRNVHADTLPNGYVASTTHQLNSGQLPTIPASKISGAFTRTASSYKLPDGLFMQWGSMNVPHNSKQTVSFPTAFGTACLMMQATCDQVGFASNSTISCKAKSKSQFEIYQYNQASSDMTITWFAVGY